METTSWFSLDNTILYNFWCLQFFTFKIIEEVILARWRVTGSQSSSLLRKQQIDNYKAMTNGSGKAWDYNKATETLQSPKPRIPTMKNIESTFPESPHPRIQSNLLPEVIPSEGFHPIGKGRVGDTQQALLPSMFAAPATRDPGSSPIPNTADGTTQRAANASPPQDQRYCRTPPSRPTLGFWPIILWLNCCYSASLPLGPKSELGPTITRVSEMLTCSWTLDPESLLWLVIIATLLLLLCTWTSGAWGVNGPSPGPCHRSSATAHCGYSILALTSHPWGALLQLCAPPQYCCGFDLSLLENTAAALYPKTYLTEMTGLRNIMNQMKTAESYNGRFNQADEKTWNWSLDIHQEKRNKNERARKTCTN